MRRVTRVFAWLLLCGLMSAQGPLASAATKHKHWAFNPPKRPVPPAVRSQSWIRNPIDAFVLARLEAEKVEPSPEADRLTLIRRLSLDLTGLAPTPQEAHQFVK